MSAFNSKSKQLPPPPGLPLRQGEGLFVSLLVKGEAGWKQSASALCARVAPRALSRGRAGRGVFELSTQSGRRIQK